MRLLIINNLASGFGESQVYDMARAFSDDGDEVCIRTINHVTPISDLLHDATSFDAVVASGGDGTVTSVCHKLANTGIPILPFPAGTANLIANNLNSPVETQALAKMVRDCRQLDFDLGEITVDDKTFGFGMIAGAGYDAQIMAGAAGNKQTLGELAYFQAAFANALPQTAHFDLMLDGEHVESDGLCLLLVNFAKLQFDFCVTKENRPRDGKFDVIILKARTAFGLIPAILSGLLNPQGGYEGLDTVEMYRAREVSVKTDPPLPLEFDGEVPGLTTPFTARILPSAVRFIVTEEAASQFGKD